MDTTRELTQMHQQNYPEILKAVYVINASKIFTLLYNALRPFLAEDTLNKTKFYGRTGWKEALLEIIDADQLPVQYGGTMTDPDGDGRCPSTVCYAGKVPENYYYKNQENNEDAQDYQTIIIPSNGRKKFEYIITKPNTQIRWLIESEQFDIGFGIKYKHEKKKEVILPNQRVNCDLYPEKGQIICKKEGTYILSLNNDFSIFRSKTVRYKIKIEEPQD